MAKEQSLGLAQHAAVQNAEGHSGLIPVSPLIVDVLTPAQFVWLRMRFVMVGSQLHRSDPADGDVVYLVRQHGLYRPVGSVRELLVVLLLITKGAQW